jgi:hypothetical protein
MEVEPLKPINWYYKSARICVTYYSYSNRCVIYIIICMCIDFFILYTLDDIYV